MKTGTTFAPVFRPVMGRQAFVRAAVSLIPACATNSLHQSKSTSLWLGGYEDQVHPGEGSA